MFRFNRIYFLLAVFLLLLEIFIGARLHDALIRPYGGDILVVILLYCLVQSFWKLPVWPAALSVLVFAYGVEVSQYFGLADRLGFRGPSLMRVLLGSYFTWVDIGCYTLGILIVLGVEGWTRRGHGAGDDAAGRGDGGRAPDATSGAAEVTGHPGEEFFVARGSIVRKIWGNADTILFIFAGASAEFALNKAVDWLYFTGKLPADPLGRLFSTVEYAQKIVFATREKAHAAIDSIAAVHKNVEASRGYSIPEEAYLDVLFQLIDYSIRSFELLQKKLTIEEKAEVFGVFHRVGVRMGLKGLPGTFGEWEQLRARYLQENLDCSPLSLDLYKRYKGSLGWGRYQLLLQAQTVLVPGRVRRLLFLPMVPWMTPIVLLYKIVRALRLDRLLKVIILPGKYREQVFRLDM